MFDDSKRLDALEKRMDQMIKAINENNKNLLISDKNTTDWIKRFEAFDKDIEKRLTSLKDGYDDSVKAINEWNKTFESFDKAISRRVTKLEAEMKKK
jgi:uncharacterized protein YukE